MLSPHRPTTASPHRLINPLQASQAAAFNGEGNAFWHLIRVQFLYRFADSADCRSECLDQEQELLRLFDLSLPSVHRFDLWDDVDAGGEASLDQRVCNLVSLFFRSSSGEDELVVGHRHP